MSIWYHNIITYQKNHNNALILKILPYSYEKKNLPTTRILTLSVVKSLFVN